MKKKVLIGVLLIIELCSIYLMYKSSNNKEVFDNKEIKEEKKEKFAIMVQDDTGKYNKSSDTTFPGTGYTLNLDKTECLDIEGNKIDNAISGSNGSITLTNKYTSYCTLYFSKCKGPVGTVLEGKDQSQITSCPVGGMYRYQGTNDVNNWICFGTSDKTTCTKDDDAIDKYMYRIIGVTPDGQLAIIKETGVKEGSTVNFYWNQKSLTSECGTNGENCTWENSRIYNRLNGLCNTNNQNCTGTGTGTLGQSNIFLNSDNYDYLKKSTWLEKINTHTWKYGDTTSTGSYNGDTIYEIENAFTSSVEAKIGLQYLHDYYYAYPGGNPISFSKAKNAWIHLSKDSYNAGITYEWLINRYGVSNTSVHAWRVNSNGGVYNSGLSFSRVVRPVFYLKSDIKISNTAGSKDEPFMITN